MSASLIPVLVMVRFFHRCAVRATCVESDIHTYLTRPAASGHPVRVRRSHSGVGEVASTGGGVTTGGAGGAGFVGPTLTSWTTTCSSPVVTLPPVLPPVSATPLVELVMPPEGGGCVGASTGFGAGLGAGVGVGVRSIVRLVAPLSRESRVSASTLKANPKAQSTRRIASIPANVDLVFVIVMVCISRNYDFLAKKAGKGRG